MIRILSSLFLTSLLLFSCKSTKDQQVLVQQDSYQPLEKALLWEITGKGIESPSYLYGTIHIIEAEDFFYPEGTLAALEATNDIYFEIDMDDMNDMSKVMGMMSEIFMDDGQTLKGLLAEDSYKMVKDHFEGLGLPMFMLNKMKPMFLTVFASGDMDFGSMLGGDQTNTSTTKSYEFEFFELANKMNKEVSGLETIEYQMQIFDKIPYKDQAEMLVESIKATSQGEEGASELEMLTKIYVEQDINAMVNMIDEDPTGMGKYNDVLLVDRNKNWIPIMSQKILEEPTFFAVGAGHLAGEFGVIHLLRKEGFTLKPVTK